MIAEALVGLALMGSCPDSDNIVPVCTSYEVDGQSVVTFMYEDRIECDVVSGQQLNIVFADGYHSAWGGDASVTQAAKDCDFMGGSPVWVQDPYRLVCEGVDF
jgi:hypothetical protein